jgi:hypothetical protein
LLKVGVILAEEAPEVLKMTQQTEYSTLTISWECSADGEHLVVLECREGEAALWRHVMEIGSAVTFGKSLAAAGTLAREGTIERQPEKENASPLPDLGGCRPLPHPADLEPVLG